MIRRIHQSTFIAEILLFVLSVGALAYLAQNSLWLPFAVVLVICLGLFVALQVIKSRPINNVLLALEAKEFRLAKRTDEAGVLDFYYMQDPNQQHERNEATRQIIEKGTSFSLLSLTAASYVDPSIKRHWDFLKPKIDAGYPFRLLLMNPFCPEKEVRDRLNGLSERYDSKFRGELIVGLYNRYPNVSVRFTSNSIYCATFFNDDEMIYDPYHLGKVGDRIENYFFALRVRKLEEGRYPSAYSPYNILKQHFEFLWFTSDDLETFVRKYAKELEGTPFGSASTSIRARYFVGKP